MTTLQDIPNLPSNIRRSAISLEAAGLTGYAWPLEVALELISWLNKNTDHLILGGDLYLFLQGKEVIYPMRESWYYEPTKSVDNHSNSIKKADSYLTTFKTHPMHPEIVVNFVLG